ncbi:MAG: tetratricopeptide repeat protein [Armatimonadetes bacterium]|nr:tetratricopeptide repeat protein [Armatimonadota bacterium]
MATKRLPEDLRNRPKKVLPIIAVLYLLTMFLQAQIDPRARELRSGEQGLESTSGGLGGEFLLLPLLGFREAAAGLLWVRCDEFFHSGDYDAILPLVRLITWLDPHADNVYITGAWHLAYNFTDSNERSDRRYIIPAQELLREGIRNNPRIPDINFEYGWQNYDKTKDYETAASAFNAAINTPVWKGSDDFPYGAPLKAHHILAHTRAKQGRIPDAIAEWERALKRSSDQLARDPRNFTFISLNAAEKNNIREIYQRYYDRYTTSNHDASINPTKYPFVIAPPPGSTEPKPWDVSLHVKFETVRSKVFKVSGKMNIADGARVDIRLTNWDYDQREAKRRDIVSKEVLEKFRVEDDLTILMDTASVRKNKFEKELDMSKDPRMYSFAGDSYKAQFTFNIRATSPHIQDRHGYSGEGLTDVKENIVLDSRPELLATKMIEGQDGNGPVWDGKTVPWQVDGKGVYGQPVRLVRVTYKLNLKQLLGQQPITAKDIVPNDVP